ncbi:efflux RND transporter periplasmic adaptor subunit [Pseudomonas sp. HR96]|uniref:efflux RND transporter periplasmic adaptor subunit n=1 Tax=Pseudomonas sp. HR96 TaxID=1027966 RepID=UPI002A75C6A9|nr:efflux RND transporter periplasmic adaptor subunit [Pseudomonas sp. HR96]WPO97882.1 efflux RND transporter periplasmic adaptor subunit [Pseudomonas sp. HR96]
MSEINRSWFAGVGLLCLPALVPQAMAEGAAPLPEVSVSAPLQQQLDTRLGFLGQFSAVDRVELRAQVGGTLTEIHFTDGQRVKKGALLFSIDPEPYQIRLDQGTAQLQQAEARLAYAKSEAKRAADLASNNAGSVQNMEQRKADMLGAQAEVAAAKALIHDAQFDLDHCRIYAPITGLIGNHQVSVGNLVSGSRAAQAPTTLLATIVSQDPVYLDFDMSESDYRQYQSYKRQGGVERAEAVQIAPGGGEDYSAQGRLEFIDNALDRASGTLHARATVANADGALTPGEFGRVRVIVAPAAPKLLVPDAAVLPDQSRFIVLTVGADDVVKPRQVQIGDLRQGLRVITSGLAADDRVVIGGLPFAAPGSKVNPQPGQISLDRDLAKE